VCDGLWRIWGVMRNRKAKRYLTIFYIIGIIHNMNENKRNKILFLNNFVIILFLGILLCSCNKVNKSNSEENKGYRNEMIFWKYNELLNYEMLNSNIDTVDTIFEKYIVIPLDDFEYYLWDEQIFCLQHDTYIKYFEDFRNLFHESDYGSIFFSIIVGNKIVLNGLNRIMPQSAQMRAYDDTEIPRIFSVGHKKEKNYFRLGYSSDMIFPHSIHDHFPEKVPNYTEEERKSPVIGKLYISRLWGNLNDLFVNELYEYFLLKDKIIKGRYDINKLFTYNVLEMIEVNE
jgi:hypothetical protein